MRHKRFVASSLLAWPVPHEQCCRSNASYSQLELMRINVCGVPITPWFKAYMFAARVNGRRNDSLKPGATVTFSASEFDNALLIQWIQVTL